MSIANFLEQEAKNQEISFMVGGWVGLVAHPIYWVIWTYVIPQPFESAAMRFFCSAASIPIILRKYWPVKTKIFLPIYWYIVLIIQLPLTFTYLMLQNNFSPMWLVCETMMILVLSIFCQNLLLYFFNLAIGVGIAYGFFYLETGDNIQFGIEHLTYLIPIPIAVVCMVLFNITMKKSYAAEKNNFLLLSLGGSIAHEVRNPLAIIAQNLHVLQRRLTGLEEKYAISEKDQYLFRDLLKKSITSATRGNHIIDLILSNIRTGTIDSKDFKSHSMISTIKIALGEYPFRDGERNIVQFSEKNDFSYFGSEHYMVFTLFNLIKNAIYHLNDTKNPQVLIWLESDYSKNYLYIKDNGPGIASSGLKNIFKDFVTFDKSSTSKGTGLGLPFCKRTMTSLKGDINCSSKEGEFTQFKLIFPKERAV